jgi:hypothetical protein
MNMKKIAMVSAFIITALSAQAQWVLQGLGNTHPYDPTGFISVVDANIVWVRSGGSQDRAYFSKTNNGGISWNRGSAPHTLAFLRAFNYLDACAITFINGISQFTKTTDGGQSWQNKIPDSTHTDLVFGCFYFWDLSEGIIVGDSTHGYPVIYRTTDSGNSWTIVPAGNFPFLYYDEWPTGIGSNFTEVSQVMIKHMNS